MLTTSQSTLAVWDSKPAAAKEEPTVLFLHGHCTNQTFFSNQVNSPLFKDYRLITLDLPGYGKSSPPKDPEKVYSLPGFADVVEEAIDSLGLKNLAIVGWSLGGHVALELTSRLSNLRGLLITGTPPIEISEQGLAQGFRITNPKILPLFGKGNLSVEEAKLLATISGYDGSDKKWFLVEAVLATDDGAKTLYPTSIPKGIGQNERTLVETWPHPICVIAGKEDSGINNDYIMHEVSFRNLWKNRVHVIEEAGHAVHMEKPEEFNTIAKAFLQDIF